MNLPPPVHPVEDEACKSRSVVGPTLERDLKNVRKGCANALNALQEDIKSVKSRLSLLEARHSVLESRISNLDAAVAPHRKLPTEIIRYIIQLAHRYENPMRLPRKYFSPDDEEMNDPHTFRPHQVCRLWREVTYTMLEIWTSAWHSVIVDYAEFYDPEPPCECNEDYDYEAAKDELSDYIQRMTRHADSAIRRGARYLEIKFANNAPGCLEDFPPEAQLKQLLVPAPSSLEVLKVCHRVASEEFLEILGSVLSSLVGLKSLELDLETDCRGAVLFPLPAIELSGLVYLDFSNKAHYDATFLSVECCYSLFTSCPQLKECKLTIACHHGSDVSSTSDFKKSNGLIMLARLKTLRFFRRDCGHNLTKCDSAALLEQLVLPSLQILDINTTHPSHNGAQTFVDLLRRSQCHLTELVIQKRITEEGQEPDWKTLIPDFLEGLEALSIPRYLLGPDVLRLIARKEYFPDLESIECRVESVEENCSMVEALLRSRYTKQHPGQDSPKSLANFLTQ